MKFNIQLEGDQPNFNPSTRFILRKRVRQMEGIRRHKKYKSLSQVSVKAWAIIMHAKSRGTKNPETRPSVFPIKPDTIWHVRLQ